jgi:general stress protein 26
MRKQLDEIAAPFVEMAHSIGIAVAATVDRDGHPHTRVMQPVWSWDGGSLTGWVSTPTDTPKVDHLRHTPVLSLTYWNPQQDTCSADCEVELVTDATQRAAAWERFLTTPPPAGFDPAIYPDWESPASPTFGVLRLTPTWLRVMPGTLMLHGDGEVWTWRRSPVDATSPGSLTP